MNIKIWDEIASNYKIVECKQVKKIALKKAIKAQGMYSFYRANAGSADIYAFSYDTIGKQYLDGTICKKIDWSGGWDWSSGLVDTSSTHFLHLDTGIFYEIKA